MRNSLKIIAAAAAIVVSVGYSHAEDDANATDETFDFEHISCKKDPHEIKVVVTGLKRSEGLITIDLFPNKEDGFLRGRGRLKQATFAAKAPATTICITAPEAGQFAMSAYHDKNANGDFDKTGLGLPDEPWGISNNPKVFFGPPPVKKALFEVTETGAEVEIKLN